MKKLLLLLALLLPMVGLVGCAPNQKEDNQEIEDNRTPMQISAETHIHEMLEDMSARNSDPYIKTYTSPELIYSSQSDSLMIYTSDAVIVKGEVEIKTPVEFYYAVVPNLDGEYISISFMTDNKSLMETAEEMYAILPSSAQTEKNKDLAVNMSIMAATMSDKTTTRVFR